MKYNKPIKENAKETSCPLMPFTSINKETREITKEPNNPNNVVPDERTMDLLPDLDSSSSSPRYALVSAAMDEEPPAYCTAVGSATKPTVQMYVLCTPFFSTPA